MHLHLLLWCIKPFVYNDLTHWGRVTHIWVRRVAIIGSDNSLSPGRCQAIIWPNCWILLIAPLGTNCSEILIEIYPYSPRKVHLKMSVWKRQPICLRLNVLMISEKDMLPIPGLAFSWWMLIYHQWAYMGVKASQTTVKLSVFFPR